MTAFSPVVTTTWTPRTAGGVGYAAVLSKALGKRWTAGAAHAMLHDKGHVLQRGVSVESVRAVIGQNGQCVRDLVRLRAASPTAW